MNEFAQKFADLTTKMRAATIERDTAVKTEAVLAKKRGDLVRDTKEFVSGVYGVAYGHVVIDNTGNISFYTKDDAG